MSLFRICLLNKNRKELSFTLFSSAYTSLCSSAAPSSSDAVLTGFRSFPLNDIVKPKKKLNEINPVELFSWIDMAIPLCKTKLFQNSYSTISRDCGTFRSNNSENNFKSFVRNLYFKAPASILDADKDTVGTEFCAVSCSLALSWKPGPVKVGLLHCNF